MAMTLIQILLMPSVTSATTPTRAHAPQRSAVTASTTPTLKTFTSATVERPVVSGGLPSPGATPSTFMGQGGEFKFLRQDSRPPSVSGGLSVSLREDPKAVLESCRISESGPAPAGPDPTPPESATCAARPSHGCDTYLAHVEIRDVVHVVRTRDHPQFSVIRYLYRDPVLNTFSSVESFVPCIAATIL